MDEECSIAREGGEEDGTSSDATVEALANDYAKLLDMDIEKEKQQLDDGIEEMLTKLDEFCGLVDVIRSDSTLCLTRTLPEIQRKSHEMNVIFERIDKLEAFVNLINTQVSAMNDQVTLAEDQIGSSRGFKKVLNNFSLPFFSKKTETPPTPPATHDYTPIEIFKTSDYFTSHESEASK
ncbi:hypothetical protein CAPTEDRAFT_228865 [Capitella teleta]|uniref:Biogenesis of lysosome-related organelles complex 1 subunit 4 n=1 Tax=Capitella teleta TaxID=283909 RepID=R7T575_CAPTE|nr:hypothetical protein CAPTEDRAFT_228865 [Capitella teleta]|eukprot:ELT88198.1 hypothetical protein CAPTEDRAFT_228865 [Capitella teleta]